MASKVFLVRGGKLGEDEEIALEHGVAVLGFQSLGSLEGATEWEHVVKRVEEAYPGSKVQAIRNLAGQAWTFLGMQIGDLVVLPRKSTAQMAIGRVAGPYEYRSIDGRNRHVRAVRWERTDVPRTAFRQDMLHSLGAFMTVCNISRHDAPRRFAAVMAGESDPGLTSETISKPQFADIEKVDEEDASANLAEMAHDQIVGNIQTRFAGHALANLVDAVLRVDGWVTRVSPPGVDGGVDILAGRGSLGLDGPKLCVQVKSQNAPADVTVYRTLQGTMQTFGADQGLLMCWGGFNRAVLAESKQGHFTVRLWNSSDLVEAIYRTYDLLPPEIQAELPLKRVWMLVPDINGN